MPLPCGVPKALGPALDCPNNEAPLCGWVALKVLAPELAGPPNKDSCAGPAGCELVPPLLLLVPGCAAEEPASRCSRRCCRSA